MKDEDKKLSTAQFKVNFGTFVGSTYAQVVGVTISDTDATLEFVYINPKQPTEGQTVARVTLPRKTLEGLARIIPETTEKYDSNQ